MIDRDGRPEGATRGGGVGLSGRSRPADHILDDVFITPRVLDQSAFVRYAEELRALIADTAGAGERLGMSKSAVDELVARATSAGDQLRKRVEAGAKLVPMIDERVDRTEKVLHAAKESLGDIDAVERRVNELITKRLGTLSDKIGELFDAHEHRVRETEDRLERAQEQAERQARRLEEAVERFDEQLGAVQQRAIEVCAQCDEAATAARVGINQALQAAEVKLDELAAKVGPVRQTLDRLDALLAGDGASTLDELDQRCIALETRAEDAARQLEQTTEQAEHARKILGDAINTGAERIDELEQRRDDVTGSVRDDIAWLKDTAPQLKESVAAARSELEALSRMQSDLSTAVAETAGAAHRAKTALETDGNELVRRADDAVGRINSRVEEAGAWLGGLIRRAQDAGTALDRLIGSLREGPAGEAITPPWVAGTAPAASPKPQPIATADRHTEAKPTPPMSASIPAPAPIPTPAPAYTPPPTPPAEPISSTTPPMSQSSAGSGDSGFTPIRFRRIDLPPRD